MEEREPDLFKEIKPRDGCFSLQIREPLPCLYLLSIRYLLQSYRTQRSPFRVHFFAFFLQVSVFLFIFATEFPEVPDLYYTPGLSFFIGSPLPPASLRSLHQSHTIKGVSHLTSYRVFLVSAAKITKKKAKEKDSVFL